MEIYIIIFFTGVGVCFISTLFGLGGGIIMVPILSLILPYTHLEAIATSLATIIMVASFNTYNFHKQHVIIWNIVPWIALTSSLFAILSGYAATFLPRNILIIIFLLFLLWVAIRTFLINDKIKRVNIQETNKIIPFGIGTLSGTVSGFTGIGGGGISTPLMLITGLVKNIQAAPTSNAIMMFTALFASISFAIADDAADGNMVLGYIHLDTSILLFLGNAAFTKVGVRVNKKLSLYWRKTVLGCILIFVSLRLILMMVM